MEKNHDDTNWTRDDWYNSHRHLALDASPSCNFRDTYKLAERTGGNESQNTSNCTLGEKVKKSDNVMPYPVSY